VDQYEKAIKGRILHGWSFSELRMAKGLGANSGGNGYSVRAQKSGVQSGKLREMINGKGCCTGFEKEGTRPRLQRRTHGHGGKDGTGISNPRHQIIGPMKNKIGRRKKNAGESNERKKH